MNDDIPTEAGQADGFRLSPSQTYLWTHAPGSWSQCRITLVGPVPRDEVVRAIGAVLARHESLRSRLTRLPGQVTPLQVVDEQGRFEWVDGDLPADPAVALHRIDRTADEDRAWQLTQAPEGAVRVRMLRASDERRVLIITASGVFVDRRSLIAVHREFTEELRGVVPDEDPLQYPDVVEWLHEQVETEEAQAVMAAWRRRELELAGAVSLPSETGGADGPAVVRVPVDTEEAAALESIATAIGCPVRALVLAAWQILLWRVTGHDEFVTGIVPTSRGLEELESAVGQFESPVPLLCAPDAGRSLADFAKDLATVLDDAAWKQFSFDGRQSDQSLPFTFSAVELPGPERAAGTLIGLDVSASPPGSSVHLELAKGGFSEPAIRLFHEQRRVSSRQAERLAGQLASILRTFIRSPRTSLDNAGLADGQEKGRILADCAGARIEPAEPELVHERFQRYAHARPDALAVRCGDGGLTYGELDVRSDVLARVLRAHGVGPGARVVLGTERSTAYVVGLLGILKAGGAFVPVDPALPAHRLAQIIGQVDPVTVLTHRGLLGAAAGVRAPVIDLDVLPAPDGSAAPGPAARPRPQDLAYVVHTSGSTGEPKGVAVTHQAVCAYVDGVMAELALGDGALLGTLAGPAADLGHTAVFGALCTGRSLFLAEPSEVLSADALLRRFRERPLDALKIVPSHLAALLEAADAERLLPTTCLVLGGEELPLSLLERVRNLRPDLRVVNHYGPTETTVGALVHETGEEAYDRVPVGRPLANYRAYVLDAKLRPVLDGAPGELYVGGRAVARGYLGRPALTAERFVPDPFTDESGAFMYRTGDVVRRRPDGSVVFLGRVDHQVKIRGHRVEPGEVEGELCRVADLSDAVVVARGKEGDRHLVAYAVPRRGRFVVADEILAALRARLPEHMVPRAIVPLPVLPLTVNGKVDRAALPAPEDSDRRPTPYAAPGTRTEIALARLWEEILGRGDVGINDDLFNDLGGNSLAATRIVARVRAMTGAAVPVSALFEAPTIRAFAKLVDAARTTAATGDLIVPVNRSGPLEPSAAQRRLWMLSEVADVDAAYNIPATFRIRGDLDTALLVRALQEVVARHEALRTNIVSQDGGPVQIVRPVAPFPVPVVDVTEAEVASRALAHAARPFDLAHDDLLRAEILRVTDQEHVLLLCLHHIVSDGWSTAVLWREITALYNAYRQGAESPLAPLTVQYADYAAWHNRLLAGAELERQLAYWTKQLNGLPTLLELPTDRLRPPVQGTEGATCPITVDPETTAALRRLSGEHRSTLFMTLLTAFNVLLYRYTGQDDIAVGTPVANRTRAEVEGLVGCFFNTLVIRTDLSGDPAFTDLLARVREVMLGAQANQDLPFERLVEALDPPRDAGHSPIFQALFVYQQSPHDGAALTGLEVEPLPVPGGVAKYDVTLDLVDDADGLTGRIEYRTDLFDAETVRRMAAHYGELLRAVARAPRTAVASLELMAPAERERVVTEWNAGHVPCSDETPVADAIEERARTSPGKTALIAMNVSLTYAQLDGAADRLAHRLRDVGVGRGTLVGLWLDRSADMVVAMLAVLKAGAAYVPVGADAPASRVAYIIEDAGISCVLTQEGRAAALPDSVQVIDPSRTCPDNGEERVPRTTGPEDLAYVIYTSGSTGHPKGVMITQRNLASFFAAMDNRFGTTVPGTWLALTDYTFDISVLELLWTLSRGFTVVLAPPELELARPSTEEEAPINFSLFYFASDGGDRQADKYRLLLEGARWADEHGFEAVWTPERHFGKFGGLYPNPTVTAAALASSTTRIGIRTGSLVLPLHHPVRVAEDWAVIDNISGGRVGISVAPGWQPHDFVLAPDNYTDRKEIMFRKLEAVRRLWRGEEVRLPFGTGEEIPVRTLPLPLQSELPVWITAAGNPETFRRAGTLGLNVLTHLLGQSVDELAKAVDVYRTARRDAGNEGDGHVTLMLHTFVSDDEDFVRRTVREPFKTYLRESVDLVRPLAQERGLELEDFDENDLDALLDHAFERYYTTSGLFGTPESCVPTVRRLRRTGVDEIACLVDFGVDTGEVLSSFQHLDRLRRAVSPVRTDDAQDIASLIDRYGVTHLQCTPSLAALLVADERTRSALRGLDWLLVGGEALRGPLAEALSSTVRGHVLNVYGPTEATIWSTSDTVTGADVLIGRPLSNTRAYVLDEALNPVPVGVPGELCLGGDSVAAGYVRQPDLTAQRFIRDPFVADPAARMYRTGDIVRYRPDGTLGFIGRRDHQVKIRGFRVEPGEVEAALARSSLVRAATVVTDEDGRGGRRLVAYVVPEAGPLDVSRLRARLENELPRHMVPATFVELAVMPLLPSGKVDRKALPGAGPQTSSEDAFVAPRTNTEEQLSRIWVELLGTSRVGAEDNFFDLGGDSIVAIQMVARAREAGIVLTARELFRYQTLSQLAAVARSGGQVRAEQGLVQGEVRMGPIQHWLLEQELADSHHYNQAVCVDLRDGPLDLGLLARARDALERQHDVLRHRFVPGPEGWRQHVAPPANDIPPVERLDLGDLPETTRLGVLSDARERMHRSLDLEHGPLLRMLYVHHGGRRPDQLLVVAHHLVIDGVSWRILMQDLETAYAALRDSRAVRLPAKTTSFKEWTGRLTHRAASEETHSELDFWTAQVEPPVAALPRDRTGENTEAEARTVTVGLSSAETESLLRELHARHKLDVPHVLLYSLAEACAPWTGSRELLVDVEGHGRAELFPDADLSRTVGWFTSLFPVRLRLPEERDDGLLAVRELLRQVPALGVGYGLLRYLSPEVSVRQRLEKAAQAEIIFNYLGQADASARDGAMFVLSPDPIGSPHAPGQHRRHLLNVNGIVRDGRLQVDFTFSEQVHAPETVQTLADRFIAVTRRTIEKSGAPNAQLSSSLDFLDLDMTQEELDGLLSELQNHEVNDVDE